MRHTIELIGTPSDEYEGRYRMTGTTGTPSHPVPQGYASDWYAIAKSIYEDTIFGSHGNLEFLQRQDGFHIWSPGKVVGYPHVVSMSKEDAIAFARHIFGTLAANGEGVGPDVPSGNNVAGIAGALLVAGLTSRVVDGIIGE